MGLIGCVAVGMLWMREGKGEEYEFKRDSPGPWTWRDNTNWTPSGFPSRSGDVASIGVNNSGDLNIAIYDNDVTVGGIKFNHAFVYTLLKSGTGKINYSTLGSADQQILIYCNEYQNYPQCNIQPQIVLSNTLPITFDGEYHAYLTLNGGVSEAPGSSCGITLTSNDSGSTDHYVTLNGTCSYSGDTTLESWTYLQPKTGTNNVFSPNSRMVFSGGGSVDLLNTSQKIGSLQQSSGNSFVHLGSGTLYVGLDNTDSTYSGTIDGSGALVKEGSGKLTLSHNNNYSWSTVINKGTLEVSNANNIGSGQLSFNSQGGILSTTDNFSFSKQVNVNAPATFDVAATKTTTLSGAMVASGSGNITKVGLGALILSGNNNFTGATPVTISQGTLQAGSGNCLSSNNALTMSSGATFDLDSYGLTIGSLEGAGTVSIGSGNLTTGGDGSSTTFSGSMSGSGGLTKNGSGTFILSGADISYGGQTIINGGTLQFTIPAGSYTKTGTIQNNSFLTFDLSGTVTWGGQISGAGSVTKEGNGTLIFSHINNYTGVTDIEEGTLQINVPFEDSAIKLNKNASLISEASDPIQVIASLEDGLQGGGTVDFGAATLEIGSDNSSTHFSGEIIAGNFIKVGSGTMALSGDNSSYTWNTFIGTDTVAGGTLQISDGESIGSGKLTFDTQGGALQTAGMLTLGNEIELKGPSIFTVNQSTTATFSNAISGSGSLTKNGDGTLILSHSNNYSGVTSINAGTLQIDSENELSLATLSFGGTGGTLQTTGDVNFGSEVTLSAPATFNINSDTTTTLSNAISGTSSLTKSGEGTLILSGTNSYGNTTISMGTLQIGSDHNLSTGSLAFSGTDGALQVTGSNVNIGNVVTLGGSGIFNIDQKATLSGKVSGSGGLTKIGAGTLLLSESNDYTGGTFIGTDTLAGGKLQIHSKANLGSGSLTFGALGGTLHPMGNLAYDQAIVVNGLGFFEVNSTNTVTLSQTISGAGSLGKTGLGVLNLTASNSYNGSTFIGTPDEVGGTLQISSDSALGNAASPLIFGSKGATLELLSSLTSARPFILNGESTLKFDLPTSVTLSGNISGPGKLINNGSGTLTLTGNNSYSGGTHVVNGTLLGDTSSIPDHEIQIDSASSGLIFNQNFDDTFFSSFAGNGTLTKTGSGNLTLVGDSPDFKGEVIIEKGILTVDGSLDPTISIFDGATLSGTGNITGDITVYAGGTINPADVGSVGTLTDIGDVVFFSGSNFEADFDLPTVGMDQLNVDGTVTIQSGTTLTPVPTTEPLAPFTSTIIHTTGGILGSDMTLVNPYPFLNMATIYNIGHTDLLFNLSFVPFATSINSGNPGRVAAYLDQQNPLVGSDLNYVLGVFRLSDSVDALSDAFDHLHPALFSAFTLAEESTTQRIRSLLSDRAYELFFTACDCNVRRDFCRGMWVSALGDFYKQNRVNEEEAEENYSQFPFHSETGGAIVGVDMAFLSNLTGGITGGFTYTSIDWDTPDTDGWTESYFTGLYASGCILCTLFDTSFIGAYTCSHADRRITYLDIDRKASHRHNSWLWNAHLGATYPLLQEKYSISPFALVDYFNQHQDPFEEDGADSLDLIVSGHRSDLLRAEWGLRYSFSFNQFKDRLFYRFQQPCHVCVGANRTGGCMPWFTTRWIPTLSASYIREWRFEGKDFTSQLEGGVGTFEVVGLNPNRGLFSPSAELLILNDPCRWAFTARYQAEFANKVWDQNIILKFSYDF